MTEIVAARLGFGWGWDEGEDGWKPGVDQNFRMNDTFTGLTIISDALTAPPGSPADGDCYIPKATATGAWATHEGKVAAYQNATWYFYPVVKGLRGLFVNHSSNFYVYDGSAWAVEATYARLPQQVQNIPASFPFVGLPPSGVEVYIPIVQDTTVPVNFAGARSYAKTPATASTDFTLSYIRSGSTTTIGTVTFTSGSGHAGVLSVQAQVDLVAGDILVGSFGTQDATLADIGITFLLKKV